jgi:hypothetical protein
MVYRAMDHGDSLGYWRAMTENQRSDQPSFKRNRTSALEDCADSDPDMREAKKRSCADINSERMTVLLTPSASPPSACIRRETAPRRDPADIRHHFLPVTTTKATGGHARPIRQSTQKEDIVEGDLYVVPVGINDVD